MTTLCLCDINEHDLGVLGELSRLPAGGVPSDWPRHAMASRTGAISAVQDARSGPRLQAERNAVDLPRPVPAAR